MALNQYQRFVGTKLRQGYDMKEAAKMWRSYKKKKKVKSSSTSKRKTKKTTKRRRRKGGEGGEDA